ncbi:hypothetical protein [Kitasatospora sp. NPDC005856]|uniref:hypothetical protein n=1 Tax=Kitasatospora sp. NPDC005856 TaxID=3154566 RepID=UPI0033D42249
MIPLPTGAATGPHDAAFLPRRGLSPRPAERPITAPVPKLGGEPCWLAEPTWPLDPSTGEPLVFIGQFPVPGEPGRLAYLFLDEEGEIMGGLDPERGDGLLLVQPGGRIPPFAVIGPPGTRGRTLWRCEPDGERTPVEYHLDVVPLSDDDHVRDHLGGEPSYPNGRARVPAPWQYLFGLSDAPDDSDPYFLNFGYGKGFGFLSPDGLEGRFFWEAP